MRLFVLIKPEAYDRDDIRRLASHPLPAGKLVENVIEEIETLNCSVGDPSTAASYPATRIRFFLG